ncbi:MAG: hypothetical protein ACXVAX_04795 [Pseudobdellovibrio sp.]
MRTLVLILTVVLTQSVLAERTDFNKILVNVGGESWTTRDMQVYQSVLSEVFKKKQLSTYSKSSLDDFLLSRMSFKEAKVLNLVADKNPVPESEKKKLTQFKGEEVDREIDLITKAENLVEIKEAQHKDANRFNAWYELMKRKYVVRIKALDIK